jgi:hypothetical protein
MRIGRVAIAVVLLAAAVFAALLAADLRSWEGAIHSGDRRFAQDPASARWGASTVLPLDPALHILGLSDQLAFRRATQSFDPVASAGNGLDNGYSESQTRGALETVLTKLAAGPNRVRDSEAENLLGILAFLDTKQHGANAPAPVDRSVSDFQSAVQLDPENVEAKFNLELLLRDLLARGVRPGGNGASPGPAKGHKGAGSGSPGKGY